ncbi:type 1 fimbrial protein, partial [Enterobacter cloacae]|nr:type 1 fimbrial protein [Enterobacter cloacae]
MRHLAKLFLFMLVMCPLKQALALNCYLGTQNGPVEQTKTVSEFSIPSTAKVGQKIWESSDIKIPVYCDRNTASNHENEDVFAWVNPYPSVSDPYYELGVTYEGADYDAIGQTYGVDTRQCLDNNSLSKYTAEQLKAMGWEKYICSGNAWDVHTSRTFAARFRLYVKLKAIPPQGYVSTLGDYIVV